MKRGKKLIVSVLLVALLTSLLPDDVTRAAGTGEVAVSPTELTFAVGDSEQTVTIETVKDSAGNEISSYVAACTGSDETVARAETVAVSEADGSTSFVVKITPEAAGTAVITVTCTYNNLPAGDEETATVEIPVTVRGEQSLSLSESMPEFPEGETTPRTLTIESVTNSLGQTVPEDAFQSTSWTVGDATLITLTEAADPVPLSGSIAPAGNKIGKTDITVSCTYNITLADGSEETETATAVIPVFVYGGQALTLSGSEITFTDSDTASKSVSVSSVTNSLGETVNVNDYNIEWLSNDLSVATVSATGEITPVGAGQTTVTVTCTYAAPNGIGEETVQGTVTVKVYRKPELELNVNPASPAAYPKKITVKVNGAPADVIPKLWVEQSGVETVPPQDVPDTGVELSLPVGIYDIKASTAEWGYYTAADVTLPYEVRQGNVEISVSGIGNGTYYWSQELTVTLSSNTPGSFKVETTGGIGITAEGSADPDSIPATETEEGKYQAEIRVTCNAVGTAAMTVTFTPEDSGNYAAPADITYDAVKVEKIPITFAWTQEQLSRTYDGTAVFTLNNVAPTVSLDGVEGFEIPALVTSIYEFDELSGADAGEYTTALVTTDFLSAEDKERYELTVPDSFTVKILPILLTADNISDFVAIGTDYREPDKDPGVTGVTHSIVEFTVLPGLVDSDTDPVFLGNDMQNMTISYIAEYCDGSGNVVYGDPEQEVIAEKVRLRDIKIILQGGGEAVNYRFADGTTREITGSFVIQPNDDFFSFTGMTETGNKVTADGIETYWFKDETGLSKSGFRFSGGERNIHGFRDGYVDEYIIDENTTGEAGRKIYAQEYVTGEAYHRVSRPINVAFDNTAPVGSMYARIDGGDPVSIEYIIGAGFDTISAGSDITLEFAGSDSGSKIASVEWYGSDTEVSTNDDSTWPAAGTTKILLNTGSVMNANVQESLAVVDKTEVQSYYYLKITDYAGNVTYISTANMVEDMTIPIAQISLAADAEQVVYENRNVYESPVEFVVKLQEFGSRISGISDVRVTLVRTNAKDATKTTVIAEYDINSDDLWADSQALTSIRKLNGETNPTAADIEAAATNGTDPLELTGTLDLEDGNYYILTVQAYDKAGNKSLAHSQEFIVDTTGPVITVSNKLTYLDERADTDAYTGGSIEITVADMTPATEQAAFLTGIEGEQWNTTLAENGFVTKTAVLFFGNESTNKEGIYDLTVAVADSMGRTAEETGRFTIDYTAPRYTVSFTPVAGDAVIDDSIAYHNSDIVATFTVEETGTYDEDLIQITVKDSEGVTVIQWKDGRATTLAGNAYYKLEHRAQSPEYVLTLKKDAAAHSSDGSYSFSISGRDKAGHLLIPDSEQSDISVQMNRTRVLDTMAPELFDVKYDTALAFYTVGGRDYVNAPTTMTFYLKEKNPIDSISSITGAAGETIRKWETGAEEGVCTTVLNVEQRGEKGDEQTVSLSITDKAGNAAVMSAVPRSAENTAFSAGQFTDRFTVDTVAPVITYEYVSVSPDSLNVDGVDYFRQPVSVRITVEEHNFDASLLECVVAGYGNGVVFNDSRWNTAGDIHTRTFTFDADSQYNISVKGTDCAQNSLSLAQVQGITAAQAADGSTTLSVAVDRTSPSVSIGGISGSGTTTDGQNLFNSDIVFNVTIYDARVNDFASGIDGITFSVAGEDGTGAQCTVQKGGAIQNGNGMSVSMVNGADLAKGNENAYYFRVSISSSVFNTNGIMLSVSAADVTRNSAGANSAVAAIDVTRPVVRIVYDNNEVSNERYFHEVRTATVEVVERNFSNECLRFMVNGIDVNLTFTQASAGSGNRDDAVWRAVYTFDEDEDYLIECTANDLVANEADITYSGDAPNDFTLDLTAPVITIAFDDGEDNLPQNGNYYQKPRTATITIEEHNFEAANVQITGAASNAGAGVEYPDISGWTRDGDTNRTTITYSADALYTLTVTYADQATNEADSPETITFTVDNTDPEITISGVEDQASYSGAVIPEISFSDNNYRDYSIVLTRTEREKKDVEMPVGEAEVAVWANGRGIGSKIIEDPAYIQENDGIYTLTVTVNDMAGRTDERRITYSVNRFGSVYVYSDDLIALMQGTKYYQSIEGELYIMVYNANRLVQDSTKLEILCDGSMLSEQASTADATDDLISGDGWYQYRFDLVNSDFSQDGSYEIMVSDKDEAENTRTNSDNPIQFYVDSTVPMVDSVIGLEESIVNAESREVSFVVSDAIGLKNVTVYVSGNEVVNINEFESDTICEGSFVLGAGMRQSIRIVAEDKAGNVLDTSEESFQPAFAYNDEVTVSTNIFVRWYANTALFWSTIAGAVGLVALAALAIALKRRKPLDEIE